MVESLQEQVMYLKEQLDIRTEELREHRRLLAGLIERVPELEGPREPGGATEARESSKTVEEEPERAEPLSDRVEAQEGVRRPWWRRVFGS